MFLFKNGLIEFVFGRVPVCGGLIIADRRGQVIEWVNRPSGFEVLLRLRPGCEFFIGGHPGFVGIALSRLAVGVHHDDRGKTGPVKVAVGSEVVAMEGVELRRPRLGDVDVAPLFPNDRPVFTFH